MKWLKVQLPLMFVFVLLPFGACTKQESKPTTPEGALERYVTTAFSAKSADSRQSLLDLSTGDAKAWLESMSADDFKKQFVDNSMVLQNLKTKDLREEKSGDVSLVYELAFRDGKTPNAAAYTNKKIAYLTKDEKGDWKIKATKNVKSFIERKDALEILTPETTDKNPATEQK
ncbi:MAG TPA: hypothetical protein VIH99_10245 [Bdellovibrionota bacterium]|jgi:ketosteroid isomerase-like protein